MRRTPFLAVLIGVIVGIIQVILGLRLLFKLFAANESAPFVQLILNASQPFMYPFHSIFPIVHLGRFDLELSTVVALIVYGIVGYFLRRLFMVGQRPRRETIIENRKIGRRL